MTDIIELLLADHRRIRRLRQALHDTARDGAGAGPGGTWARLAWVIELHLSAEQEICWLPMCGTGPRGREQIAAAAAEAADIMAAIGESRLRPAGSPCWWRAVNDALSACVAQLRREEDGILAGFARRADWSVREQLGRQWLAYTAARRLDQTPAGRDERSPAPVAGRVKARGAAKFSPASMPATIRPVPTPAAQAWPEK